MSQNPLSFINPKIIYVRFLRCRCNRGNKSLQTSISQACGISSKQTELFCPIAPIIKAATDGEAIALAGDTEYGLNSAIYTADLQKGEELALHIDAGMTHINDQTVNDAPFIPFGGNKSSGLGRFGNPWVVEEFTATKWVSVQTRDRQYPF